MKFNEIHVVYKLQYAGQDIVCSHYPLESVPDKFINIHGHIHASNPIVKDHINLSDRHINVNCEFHNYMPIKLSSLLKMGHISSSSS